MVRLLHFCTFDRLLTTLLFLAIVVACGLTPMQTDTWWQLRAGQDMWHSGRVMLTDVYSHTAYGAYWVNHEWLAELVYYAMYRAGGFALVTLFAAALIVGGWALSWSLTKGPVREAFLVCALALVPAATWWEPRPHAFSLLFIPASVALVARRKYLWLPPVFLVWANCHGGVLLGFVIAAVGVTAQVWKQPRTWRVAALAMIGCAVAMTATPLGIHFWTEIPKSLARIRLYPLDEWQPPRFGNLAMATYWVLAAAFAAGVVRFRHRLLRLPGEDLPVVACALVLFPLSLMAIRNVGPFLMLAVPVLTMMVPFVQRPKAAVAAEQRGSVNLALMTCSALGVAITLTWAYLNEIPKLRWKPVPDLALAALQQCPGNLYNRYDEGGALLWFAPERKVFMDGRQDPYPPELVLEHIRMETGQSDYREVFARHDIRCAYLPTISPTGAQLTASGWKALYRDQQWVVLAATTPTF
jgi:hypothetical protein